MKQRETQTFVPSPIKNRLPRSLGRRQQLILQFGHPQTMEIAVCIDGNRLVIAQAEGDTGVIAGLECLALAATGLGSRSSVFWAQHIIGTPESWITPTKLPQ